MTSLTTQTAPKTRADLDVAARFVAFTGAGGRH